MFWKLLKKKLEEDKELNYWEAFIQFVSSLPSWPTIELEVEENKFEDEALDTENFCMTSLSDNSIIFCAGGDWQDALQMTLVLDGDNFIITHLNAGYDDCVTAGHFINRINEIKS